MGDDLDVISDQRLHETREAKGDGFEGMWIGYCKGEMGFAGVKGDLRLTSACGVPRLRRREFNLEGSGGSAILAMRFGVRSRWCDLSDAGVQQDRCDLGLGWWCDLVQSSSHSLLALSLSLFGCLSLEII